MISLLDAATHLRLAAEPHRGTGTHVRLVVPADDVDWAALRVRGLLPPDRARPWPRMALPAARGDTDVVAEILPSGWVSVREWRGLPPTVPPDRGLADAIGVAQGRAAALRQLYQTPLGGAVLLTESPSGTGADPLRWRTGLLGLGRGWSPSRGPEAERLAAAARNHLVGSLRGAA